MLAIAARDRGELPVLFQALMYPMLDDRYGATKPLPPHVESQANSSWKSFSRGGARLEARSLTGFPVGWRMCAACLRRTSASGPSILSRSLVSIMPASSWKPGVMTELYVAPGAYHAFNAVDSELARQFNAAYYGAIARAFRWGYLNNTERDHLQLQRQSRSADRWWAEHRSGRRARFR